MTVIEFMSILDEAGFAAARILLTALWQSSILIIAVGALTWKLRRRQASIRCALWIAALLAAPFLPFLKSFVAYVGAPQAPIPVLPDYEGFESAAPAKKTTSLARIFSAKS